MLYSQVLIVLLTNIYLVLHYSTKYIKHLIEKIMDSPKRINITQGTKVSIIQKQDQRQCKQNQPTTAPKNQKRTINKYKCIHILMQSTKTGFSAIGVP